MPNAKSRMPNPASRTVLVTGGAGYVGAVLVPKLLRAGHRVKVLDWYLFGLDVLHGVEDHSHLEQIQGDIRNADLLARHLPGCDSVIHLACISNDPSCELNPALTRQVNFEAFAPLVQASKRASVRRFIYASTSSVYGVSDAEHVCEDHPLAPLTDYSRYKAQCEPILLEQQSADFVPVILRPATVCVHSPRQRLDVVVNLLATQAVHRRRITVFGGKQMRSNIHIDDLTDLYVQLLKEPEDRVAGQVFNAGGQNLPVARIAQVVREVVKQEECLTRLPIMTKSTDDVRSYHICSKRIKAHLGFVSRHTVEDAVHDLVCAFQAGRIPNAIDDDRYYNVRMMRAVEAELTEGVAA